MNKDHGSGAWVRFASFTALSVASFFAGLGLLALTLWDPEKLVALGLVDRLYYIVLLPLGVTAGSFLFLAVRSFAQYTGKQLGGTLRIGGPIVVAALVVIGGFALPKPQPEAFDLAVFVHGEMGEHDLVLRNTGVVWLTLGRDRRHERIGDKGEANFLGIPGSFRGGEVMVSVEAEGFEPVGPDQKRRLDGNSLYLPIRRKAGTSISTSLVSTVGEDEKVPTSKNRPITNTGGEIKGKSEAPTHSINTYTENVFVQPAPDTISTETGRSTGPANRNASGTERTELHVLPVVIPPSQDQPVKKQKPNITITITNTITSVPPDPPSADMASERIKGIVVGANPKEHKVVIYARGGDTWYVQPYAASLLTDIGDDGKWESDTHGGTDFAALVVKFIIQSKDHAGYNPDGWRGYPC